MSKRYTFEAAIWVYPGNGGWRFASVPKDLTKKISDAHKSARRGWGSLPVRVKMNGIAWETSIFPDSKSGSYLLPLKRDVRQRAKTMDGDRVKISLEMRT